jgi:hypothetical protein
MNGSNGDQEILKIVGATKPVKIEDVIAVIAER